MSDAMDPQDQAEALDGDKIGGEFPPEEPMGVDEPEVTPLGEATSESFEERDARHQVSAEDDRPVIQPYQEAEEDLLDDEAQVVAEAEVRGGPGPGQVTTEADGGGAAAVESDPAPPAAEEAALHLEGESPPA